jgi:acyl-CoA synthetase (AMP-forming)/AMP-acid ligase II
MNIATILQAQAAERPEAIAIIDVCRGQERSRSYAMLARDAAKTAALLQAHGVVKGDRVLLFQAMSYELYVALLAIFQLGAVAMFIDPSAGRQHIDLCCDIGRPKALMAGWWAHWLRLLSAKLRRIPKKFVIGGYLPGAIPLRRGEYLAPLDETASCSEQDSALLTFTSGSTGKPKAALRSQAFLMAQHRVLEQALKLQPGEVDLTTLPIFLLANLASGLTSVIPYADLRFPGRIDPAPVVEQIDRYQVTRSAGSPAFYQRLVDYCEMQGRVFSSLRRVDTGGAPVFPRLLQRLQQWAPKAQVVTVYGSTEAEPIAHLAWREVGEDELTAMRSGRGLVTGPSVDEVSLRILRDRFGTPIGPYSEEAFDRERLPVGEIGEIVLTGNHVLKGYLHGEGDRETKFDVDGVRWHRTGDAGYIDQKGRLWLMGRCNARVEDDKGVLYPFSVECAAHFVADVRRSAMVAHRGQRILLVEAPQGADTSGLKARLAWAGLDEVRRVEKIPVDKRHNAKVDYTRLQDLLNQQTT